ncbi:hypothetical protein V5O48_001793 [Marasmius crinis-equi]|uniref:Piwi domain-containing protein n=1 Tax=Marasmius crinis-equi TaxID=585013 RepID=A0ABR3FXX3_9AGAR
MVSYFTKSSRRISNTIIDLVDFFPEVRDFARRQEIVRKLHTTVAPYMFRGLPIYDGKRLMYVPEELQLEGTSQHFSVSLTNAPYTEGGRGCYQVRLEKTAGLPVRPARLVNLIQSNSDRSLAEVSPEINLLQLLIRQHPNERHPHNARAYFSDTEKKPIKGGLELWRGFFHSVRPTIGRMLVNIDTTMTAVYQAGALTDVAVKYLDIQNARNLSLSRNSPSFIKLERFLRNVKIIVDTTKRTKVIRGLEPNADAFAFTDRDGQQLTVGQYLQRTYNIQLRYRGIVGVRLSGARADHAEILPLELCNVKEGQLYRRKLSDEATAEAVSFSSLKPDQRLSRIMNKGPLESYTTSQYIRQSQMAIDPRPLTVEGRLLTTPNVMFSRNRAANVRNGNGAWNVMQQAFQDPVPLDSWAAVSFVDSIRRDALTDKMLELADCCGKLGMSVKEPIAIREGNAVNPEAVLNDIFRDARNKQKEATLLIVVVLPQSAGALRARIKYWSDVVRGVRTQCVRQEKFWKSNNQYWNNIALKLNARLGGSNFAVDSEAMTGFRRAPSMVMGADVGHPGPGVARPSVASLVWSTDAYATRYSATSRLQHPRLEAIEDLEEMAEIAILDFMRMNNDTPPKRIFFFRDGVSEGEFDRVSQVEIQAIRAVWLKRKVPDPPKLTYLIVGKRHHIAFFPDANSPMNDGKGNCKAGFVSESDLRNPFSKADFYLQSHSALIGTSRSSHYTLLLNEVEVPTQKLQELAFSLCHVYAKATRSVSIPAPVYYADLACQRLAFHFRADSALNLSDSASVTSDSEAFDLDAWKSEFAHINANLARTMYFL